MLEHFHMIFKFQFQVSVEGVMNRVVGPGVIIIRAITSQNKVEKIPFGYFVTLYNDFLNTKICLRAMNLVETIVLLMQRPTELKPRNKHNMEQLRELL